MNQTIAKRDVKLMIRRVGAVLLLLLVIPTTVSAFWLYNANRVVLSPTTYKDNLNNRVVYNELLGALISGSLGNKPKPHPRNVEALVPLVANGGVATAIFFPDNYAQKQVNDTIDQLNDWINGKVNIPNVSINLGQLKDLLTASAPQAATNLIGQFGPCGPPDEDKIKNFSDTDSFDKLPQPLCKPKSSTVLDKLQKQLIAGFSLLSTELPDSWNLSEELKAIDTDTVILNENKTNNKRISTPQQLDSTTLSQIRAFIWLVGRLMVLLFLIPIALICIIVIVIVRSIKTFFRWLSWSLILSGFVSLIPVLLFALGGITARISTLNIYDTPAGTSEMVLNPLTREAIPGILNILTLDVVIQVAILIVVGLIAAFISIILTKPEPELSDADLEAFISAQSGTTSIPSRTL